MGFKHHVCQSLKKIAGKCVQFCTFLINGESNSQMELSLCLYWLNIFVLLVYLLSDGSVINCLIDECKGLSIECNTDFLSSML